MTDASTLVFDIEKFAVHDGPGLRTVVFMKGCPLHCLWCHNPESQAFTQEVFFSPEKCIGCGWCVSVCPKQCHLMENGVHVFDRTNCMKCGKCTEKCYAGALECVGKMMTVSDVMEEVLKDRMFYETTGGGITLSGGEPLAAFDFTFALLKAAKKEKLHTAIETSGYADLDKIQTLLPLVDLWLWDVKAAPSLHKKLTGVDNASILENLKHISSAGASIILRCPMIPGVNDANEALDQIVTLSQLPGVQEINIEPYHPLGESKNVRLATHNDFHASFAPKEKTQLYVEYLQAKTCTPVLTL